MKHVLLAGATGYLGAFIAKELKSMGYYLSVVVRDKKKLLKNDVLADEVFEGDLTDSSFYTDVMRNVDVVISTVGITRQKDGQTYMAIDYGVNHLLLKAAEEEGVSKFIYVSVLHGKKLKYLKICEAKERFVSELKKSSIESLVVRPSGFFSDMEEFLTMAASGRVFLFGNGLHAANPIHGADLAKVIVDGISMQKGTLDVGGPDILTHKQIAQQAFKAVGREEKILYIPYWIQMIFLSLMKLVTSEKTYGPTEFFLTVMNMNMVGPQHGKKTLMGHFNHKRMDYFDNLIDEDQWNDS